MKSIRLYWFDLGEVLLDDEMKLVLVTSYHVKKSKKFDDNNLTKNDSKNLKTRAGLAKEEHYIISYLPDGIYTDMRITSGMRSQLLEKFMKIWNHIIPRKFDIIYVCKLFNR